MHSVYRVGKNAALRSAVGGARAVRGGCARAAPAPRARPAAAAARRLQVRTDHFIYCYT